MKKKSHSQSMQLQYCPRCGAKASSDDLFCAKCGASLFTFDPFSTPDAPSGRRTKKKKSGFPWGVAAILAGAVACLVLVMLMVPRFTRGGTPGPTTSSTLASAPQPAPDARRQGEAPVPTETKKENRLMESHPGPGFPMFDIPELLDVGISSYTFQSTLSGAPADAWDVSQNQDGSVLAWLVRDGKYRHMFIAADGIIKAPKNCHGMFHNQSATQAIRFNGCLDTSEVTDMGGMFGLCRGLTELDLTGFDTSRVTDMSGMFHYCESIKTLDLRSFDTANVTDMSEMFAGCYALSSIITDGLDMSSVGNRDDMFFQCNQLDTSRIPLLENRGSSNAMKANEELAHRWIFDLANPGDILSIQFASSLDGAPVDALDASQAGDRSVLAWAVPSGAGKKIIIAAEGKIQAPADCRYLFAHCENLTSIQFNGCLDTSRVTDMTGMFYCCESLQELDVTSFDTGNVTNMADMFYSCGRLTRLDLSSFDTRRVTIMGGLVSGCHTLEYLDLSGFDTSHVTNMDCMFTCCEELSTVKIGVLDMRSVERADGIFSGCPKLDVESLPIINPDYF